MKKIIYSLVMTVMTIATAYSQFPIQNYEYEYKINHLPVNNSPDETWIERYFFGPEVTVQNKKYLPFTNKDTNETEALIRQEGRKAYILITKEFLEKHPWRRYDDIPYPRIPKEGEELLIWDFETPIGESYEGFIQDEYLYVISYHADIVLIEEELMIYSEASQSNWPARGVRVGYFAYDVIMEGLGARNSYLYAPFLAEMYDTDRGYYISLVSVKDRTDNYKVIYGDENNGVETIKPTTVQDNRMYDLMGREIRNPEKGTVYIQNGRKFIAR